MAYESMHENSPFRQRVPEVAPEVLKPLRYCEFRSTPAGFGDGPPNACAVFACAEVLEMTFCYQHMKLILGELAAEGGAKNVG